MFDIEPAEVGGVVDFYHMFKTEPTGEYHVEVCTNVPCMLRRSMYAPLRREVGHPSRRNDRRRQVLVGTYGMPACGTAPMAMVTERATDQTRYFEEMESAEDVQKALDVLASGKGFSTLERWTPEGDPESTGKAAGPYRVAAWNTRC